MSTMSWFRLDHSGLTQFVDELIEQAVKPYENQVEELNDKIEELQETIEELKEQLAEYR